MINATTRNYVLSLVRRRLNNAHDVEDVTQDALLRAHRFRDSYRGDSAYKSWLYRVTMTAISEHIRQGKRAPSGDSEVLERFPSQVDTHNHAAARVELARVESVVESLGHRLEAVFWQSVRDGMTEREIATAHGLSISAVKARINRAKHAVRATLRRDLEAA